MNNSVLIIVMKNYNNCSLVRKSYIKLLYYNKINIYNISELVLKQQQEEYEREGIAWQNIDYFNNQIICELVEQPHKGIIAIMDEACLNVGKVTDEVSFLNYFNLLYYFIYIYNLYLLHFYYKIKLINILLKFYIIIFFRCFWKLWIKNYWIINIILLGN